MSIRQIVLLIGFGLLYSCSSGPYIDREYKDERLRIEIEDNKLGGSYWEGDNVSRLELNLFSSKKDNKERTFGLYASYYGNGRVFESNDRRLIIDFDDTRRTYNPFFVDGGAEMITKKVSTGEIVDRGEFLEFAGYNLTFEDIELFVESKDIRIIRLGSNTSGIWYFNEENKKIVREFFKELYKF